jgi:predicted nucleic acid-binding protein
MALNVKLVLDTCAVRNRDLLDWLARRTSGDVCISAVVYMELCRQTLARGNTIDGLRKLIDKHHIKILPFDKHTAEIAAEYMNRDTKPCPTCNKLDWADTMIYASVGVPPTIFVTDNIGDFPSDYPDYIKTPKQIMQM